MPATEQASLVSALVLRRYTQQTIVRKRELKQHLLASTDRGFFASVEEHQEGVMSLAVPIRVQGHLLGVGLVGPFDRMSTNVDVYKNKLLALASGINF